MKKTALLIAALCLAATPAVAQKTQAQLQTEISSNLPSGQPNILTAASLRQVLNDMVLSTNVAGTTCPTTSLTLYQNFTNTLSAPTGTTLNIWDGNQCVPWATLNTAAHTIALSGVGAAVNNVVAPPFNADPTGTNDSTAAIQAAINALPITGGDVVFPAGIYKITSTINLGNGSGAAGSSRYGIRLIGTGQINFPSALAGYSTVANVKLLWAGAAAGTVVKVNGPLQGWGLQNLIVDCASLANRGLDVVSAQFGDTRNIALLNCETWGIFSETVAPFGSFTQTGALHNRYDNVSVLVPTGIVGGGIILTSAGTTSNTLFNLFTNTAITMVGNAQTGIYLQEAAGNTFVDTQISGPVGVTSVQYDYSINSSWPANNTFLNMEPANTGTGWATNTGAPGAGAKPNFIYNLITVDGATYPTLANLVTDGGQLFGSQTNDTANTGNIGEIQAATVVVGSAVALVTGTAKTVTSISLTAGDWDVSVSAGFTGSATATVSQLFGSISATTNTLDTTDTRLAQVVYVGAPTVFNVANPQFAVGPSRFSLSATTTINLVEEAVFAGGGTASGFGTIRARRVR